MKPQRIKRRAFCKGRVAWEPEPIPRSSRQYSKAKLERRDPAYNENMSFDFMNDTGNGF